MPNQLNQSKASEEGNETENFLMKDQETGSHQPDTKDVTMLDDEFIHPNLSFKTLFRCFDVNQNGVICKEDVKATFAAIRGYSDVSISNMIENFDQTENAEQVIQFPTFKRNASSKIKNPFTKDDLRKSFQKVIKISDGIQIIGTDSKQECEIVNIETIVEALNSEAIDNIGNLNNAGLKIVLDTMVRDGINGRGAINKTQSLTFEEFSDLIKEYVESFICLVLFTAYWIHDPCPEKQAKTDLI